MERKCFHFPVTTKFENITKHKDTLNNIFAFKVHNKKNNETVDNLLCKIFGSLENTLCNNPV